MENLNSELAAQSRPASLPMIRTRRIEAVVGSSLLALLYLGWMGNDLYRQDMIAFGCAYAIIALGMYIPLVMSGSLSVAYNSYYAAGAYAVGLIAAHSSLSLLSAVPAAIIVSAMIAIGIGFASKGLTGYHLAVATLAAAQVGDRVLVDADGLTGGVMGIGNIPHVVLFGVPLQRYALLAVGLVLVTLLAIAVNRLRDSVWGLALRLQRDAPLAAEACGVPTELSRIVSLGIGAAIASLGGVFYALINQFIIPESFTLAVVFTVIFVPVIGGSSSAWGCVIGAAMVMVVNEVGSRIDVSGALVFGLGVLAILALAPTGILGLVYAVLSFKPSRKKLPLEARKLRA